MQEEKGERRSAWSKKKGRGEVDAGRKRGGEKCMEQGKGEESSACKVMVVNTRFSILCCKYQRVLTVNGHVDTWTRGRSVIITTTNEKMSGNVNN